MTCSVWEEAGVAGPLTTARNLAESPDHAQRHHNVNIAPTKASGAVKTINLKQRSDQIVPINAW